MTTEKSYKEFYILYEKLGRLKMLLNMNYGLAHTGFGFMNKEKIEATIRMRKITKTRLKESYSEYKMTEKLGNQTIFLN